MNKRWFSVKCKVDNGCNIETYESLIYAADAAQAAIDVKFKWNTSDSETVATVESVRVVSENEIWTRQV